MGVETVAVCSTRGLARKAFRQRVEVKTWKASPGILSFTTGDGQQCNLLCLLKGEHSVRYNSPAGAEAIIKVTGTVPPTFTVTTVPLPCVCTTWLRYCLALCVPLPS